jgi:para-nitrobenzyl esterase
MMQWVLTATLICGASVLTSCTDNNDNPSKDEPEQKVNEFLDYDKARERMQALYGENKQITDGNYDQSLAVKCINGTFVGQKTDNVISYLGIPFVGQQPVGSLRWKAPVEYTPSDGIFEAYYYGKTPFQAEGDPSALYIQGEDCLYLNVWKADEATTEKKPVMVWIYGGGFETGGTIDPQYDCYNFLRENPDVIVVTVAYRLAAYGFMHLSHLPDGKDYPDAQNLGIMDQMMGLKWVHENIAGFGGDPDNVTIFGESAGGSSCALLSLIEEAHKYFKRAIIQSGSPIMTRSREEAIAVTDKIMAALDCKTVADLQKVEPRKLADKVGELFGIYQVLGWSIWPERDGKLLPEDGWKAYEDGKAKDIALLLGCNKDEFNVFSAAFGAEKWNKWAADRMAKRAKLMTAEENALVESYVNSATGEDWEKTSALFSQSYFNAPAIRMSETQTKAGGKVFTYLFTPEASTPGVKSGHAIEQSAVFNHPELSVQIAGRAFDEIFCKTIRKMWIQFAKTGNPSLTAEQSPDGTAKEWPLYDTGDKHVMVLDEFNIHPAKESDVKIVDWDKTYFLTKLYCN